MFREDRFPLKWHTNLGFENNNNLHLEQTISLQTNTKTHSLTLSRYHPAPMPVLSCSMRTFFMGPTQFVLTRNVSLLPRLNMVLLLFFRWILRVVPVLPNKVMKTLALVPPPITSPVTVTISYSEKWIVKRLHILKETLISLKQNKSRRRREIKRPYPFRGEGKLLLQVVKLTHLHQDKYRCFLNYVSEQKEKKKKKNRLLKCTWTLQLYKCMWTSNS